MRWRISNVGYYCSDYEFNILVGEKEISIFTAISEIMQLSQGLNNPAIVYGILTEAIREFEDDKV